MTPAWIIFIIFLFTSQVSTAATARCSKLQDAYRDAQRQCGPNNTAACDEYAKAFKEWADECAEDEKKEEEKNKAEAAKKKNKK